MKAGNLSVGKEFFSFAFSEIIPAREKHANSPMQGEPNLCKEGKSWPPSFPGPRHQAHSGALPYRSRTLCAFLLNSMFDHKLILLD